MSAHLTPAIARRQNNEDELSTFAIWRRQAYYEFKDVPVKGKVYRYWYLRYREGGTLRSVYLGKEKPTISPRAKIDELALERKSLDRDSLNRAAPGPELPKPEASSSSSRSPARPRGRRQGGLGSGDRRRPRRSALPKPARSRRRSR